MKSQLLHETNWLGNNLVFFNKDSHIVDENINKLIDLEDIKFNNAGLSSYMASGFIMWGITPFDRIQYTLPNTKLYCHNSHELEVITTQDPFECLLDKKSSVEELLHLLEKWFKKFQVKVNEEDAQIILPLSGGLDSRMLAGFLKGNDQTQTYSYGISIRQSKSFEVFLAEEAAKKMNLHWEHIELKDFHLYLNDCFELYGPSTHAHSMYHMEFYRKILQTGRYSKPSYVLSGIYGDVWAGSWNFPTRIHKPLDLLSLIMHHGLVWSSENLSHNFENLLISFFDSNKELLEDPKFRILTAARFKVPLIRHLIETPRSLGLKVESPFLDPEIVACMLNLPTRERENRLWQHKYIEHLYGKRKVKNHQKSNYSDFMATYRHPLPRLQVELLPNNFFCRSQISQETTHGLSINWIHLLIALLSEFLPNSKLLRIARRLLRKFHHEYARYMVLHPIIEVLKRSQNKSAQSLDT